MKVIARLRGKAKPTTLEVLGLFLERDLELLAARGLDNWPNPATALSKRRARHPVASAQSGIQQACTHGFNPTSARGMVFCWQEGDSF